MTVGGLRAILDLFPDDMLEVTTGLDGAGFARIWPGRRRSSCRHEVS